MWILGSKPLFRHCCYVLLHGCLKLVWSVFLLIVIYKQNPAYERRISDCSSDVCSSDLPPQPVVAQAQHGVGAVVGRGDLVEHPGTAATTRIVPFRSTSLRSEERRVGKECVSTCRSR